ncbi:MAG: HAD family hydrolase [Clostridia bacterium]|nr:HAD family hydrolase [Clostridia bacterium]
MDISERPDVFIDVDGTLFDTFKEDDKRIVKEIFGSNVVIKIIDSILWKINSLDYISNSIVFLKLRFLIYSIFSFKKYSVIISKYENMYKYFLNRCLMNIDSDKLKNLKRNYDVHIVTNNPFSIDVIENYFEHIIFCKHTAHRIRNIEEHMLKKSDNCIKYFVGNNYQDDVEIAKKMKAKSVYVGSSKIVKKLMPYKCVKSFDEALDFLLISCR